MKHILFFILIHFAVSAQAEKIDFNSLLAESEPLSKSGRVTLVQNGSDSGFFTENASPHDQEIKIKINRRPTQKEVSDVRLQLRKKLNRIKSEAAERKLSSGKKKSENKGSLKVSLVKTKKHMAGSVKNKSADKKRAKEASQIRQSELKKKLSSHKRSKARLLGKAKLDTKLRR